MTTDNRERAEKLVGEWAESQSEYSVTFPPDGDTLIDRITSALDEKDKIHCGECDQVIEGSHFCFICIQVLKERLDEAQPKWQPIDDDLNIALKRLGREGVNKVLREALGTPNPLYVDEHGNG